MNAAELKERARELGADLIGIAPYERWAELTPGKNPRSIMPQCKSVIVIGRKILRGAFRGVEEGTNFGSTYGHYGRDWHESVFFPRVTYALCNELESCGAEAMPLSGGMPGGENSVLGNEGVAANVRLDTNFFAHAAGLGSMGKGAFFLSSKYGHRQRFGLILTDLELAGDPLLELDLCRDCDACLQACPLQAMTRSESGDFVVNTKLCGLCDNGRQNSSGLRYAPLDRLAAACGRACLVALENKIEERFQTPFRKRAVWERDIHGQTTLKPLPAKGE
jgi:epoxyqueuosine reductase